MRKACQDEKGYRGAKVLVLVYLKKVIEAMKAAGKSDEDIKKFQTGVQQYFVKVVKPNFKDYDFYTGESQDHEGM